MPIMPREYPEEAWGKRTRIVFHTIVIVVMVVIVAGFVFAIVLPSNTGITAERYNILKIDPLIIATVLVVGGFLCCTPVIVNYLPIGKGERVPYYLDEIGDKPDYLQELEKDVL